MIKVLVKKQNEITHQADFATQQEAESFVATVSALGSFGRIAQYTRPATLEQELEFQQAGYQTRQIDLGEETITEYFLPADFEVEYQDITAETEAQRRLQQAFQAQSLGALIIAKVWSINESKQVTAEQFQAILQDPTLQNIERLLWNGSLKTAKLLIQSLDTSLFTAEEKQQILDMLQDY